MQIPASPLLRAYSQRRLRLGCALPSEVLFVLCLYTCVDMVMIQLAVKACEKSEPDWGTLAFPTDLTVEVSAGGAWWTGVQNNSVGMY